MHVRAIATATACKTKDFLIAIKNFKLSFTQMLKKKTLRLKPISIPCLYIGCVIPFSTSNIYPSIGGVAYLKFIISLFGRFDNSENAIMPIVECPNLNV